MKNKTILFSIVLTMIFVVTSCYSNSNSNDSNSNTSAISDEPQSSDTKGTDDSQITDAVSMNKYNSYINVYNFINGDLDNVLTGYYKNLGHDQTPVYSNNFDFSMSPISQYDVKDINTAAANTTKSPLYGEVDSKIKELTDILTPFVQTLQEADKYYDEKNYVDDNYEKGKELHTSILDQDKKLTAKFDEVSSDIKAFFDKEHKKHLEELKAEGDMISYYAASCLDKMDEIQNILDESEATSDDITKIDLNKYKDAYNSFVGDYNEFMKLADAKIDSDIKNTMLYLVTDSYKRVKINASILLDYIENNKTFNTPAPNITEGTPECLTKKMDFALDQYNSWFVR